MDKEALLAALYEDYSKHMLLRPVADGKRLVRGHGQLDAPLLVLGEAPGREEDARGVPFCGPSGQLLQEMFAEAGLPWELCYVTNVLPWRPPGNRAPYPYEISASYRRVETEIDTIGPAIVVAAGATAWRAVSQNDLGLFSEHRGTRVSMPWKDWAVLPVFHPSAILRAGGHDYDRMRAETVSALRSLREAASASA